VRSEDQYLRFVDVLVQALVGLFNEVLVTGRNPLVHEQDIDWTAGCDRKQQPHHHARRVRPDRQVEEVAKSAELSDSAHSLFDRRSRETEQQPPQEYVLVACRLVVETGVDIEQRDERAVRTSTRSRG